MNTGKCKYDFVWNNGNGKAVICIYASDEYSAITQGMFSMRETAGRGHHSFLALVHHPECLCGKGLKLY